MLAGRALLVAGERRIRYLGYLSVSLFFPLHPGIIRPLLAWISWQSPLTYDLRAYQLDGMVGFQPAFAVMRLARPWDFLLTGVYEALPVMLVVAILLSFQQAERGYFDCQSAIVVAGTVGVALYAVFPAAGTRFLCSYHHLPYPPLLDPALSEGLPPLLPADPRLMRN